MKGANTSHNGIVSVAQITNDNYDIPCSVRDGGIRKYILQTLFIGMIFYLGYINAEKSLVFIDILLKLRAHY